MVGTGRLSSILVLLALAATSCAFPPPERTPEVATVPAEEVGRTSGEPTAPPSRPAAHGTPRAPRDVPDHFLAVAPSGAAREPSGGDACPGQVQDPLYSARLTLARSRAGQGDYEVPPGRYGVGDGELLRIECATGKAVAIVMR
jgi:hypothetical protein